MNEKPLRIHRRYDLDFRLSMLKEYYSGDKSQGSFCREHSIDRATFQSWRRLYEKEFLSLPSEISELESQVYIMAHKRHQENSVPRTEEERLRDENERLRKALAYSELRNEALNELIRIGREKYNIDLLKKAGAKQ